MMTVCSATAVWFVVCGVLILVRRVRCLHHHKRYSRTVACENVRYTIYLAPAPTQVKKV